MLLPVIDDTRFTVSLSSRTPGRRLASLSAMALLALSACSSEAEEPAAAATSSSPAAQPSASASPTPTPTASPTPTLPAEAEGKGREAAEAFARYWVDALNYGSESLDAQPLRQASAQSCGACIAIAERMEEIDSAGGFSRGGQWMVLGTVVSGRDDDFQIDASIQTRPQSIKDSADSRVRRSGSEDFLLTISVGMQQGRWVVSQLDFPQVSP